MHFRSVAAWVTLLLGAGSGACLDARPVNFGAQDAGDEVRDDASSTTQVETANPADTASTSCLALVPASLDFGAVMVGESANVSANLVNCGDVVEVGSLEVSGTNAARFSLASSPASFTIAPGAIHAVVVTYTPDAIAALDGTGMPMRDAAELVVANTDAHLAPSHWSLVGWGRGVDTCPVATIALAEDGLPLTAPATLHLDGAKSVSPFGAPITRYEWTVEQPSGSTSNLMPSANSVSPSFTAVRVGAYRFQLVVWDALGNRSCGAGERVVDVGPSQVAIYVELSWHTPGDLNETDEGDGLGSDVDLHFLHPNANQTYLNFPFDVFYENPNPNWGGNGSDDDPHLLRDDTDGAGPEMLEFNIPQFDRQYRVGANYWNDWGYGPAYVSARVYLWGELEFEATDVMLVQGDLWDICTIGWPGEVVTPIVTSAGGQAITPNFASENVAP